MAAQHVAVFANNMPPRRNNQLPPSVEPDLPALNPASQTSIDNSLASVDPNYTSAMSDGSLDVAPEDVVNNLPQDAEVRRAEPNLKPTGAFMNIGFIQQLNNAATDEEFNAMYDALDPALQHVYDRSYNQQVSPKWASETAQEYYQMQDRARVANESPQAKALDIAQADRAQKTVEMSNDILSIMDRLRGFKKGEEGSAKKTPKYLGRVGPFDSGMIASVFGSGKGDRVGWYVDHDTLESTLALAEAQANRGQGNFTETERAMLKSAATGGLNYRRDDDSYAQIFESMYDMFKNKTEEQKSIASPNKSAPAAAAQPAPAAAAPGLQLNKKYKDARGVTRIYKGTDSQGNPVFVPVQ